MQTFVPVFIKQHVQVKIKDRRNVELRITRYFGPLLSTKLPDITRLQILEWFNGIAAYSPAQANGCLSLLRTMYAKAQEWGLYEGENRAKYITKRPQRPRKTFLEPDQMRRLLQVLQHQAEWLQLYIELCLICGPRPGEARTMRWADIEFFEVQGVWQGRWNKPTTKTTPHSIPIPSALATRLSAMPRRGAYVFHGRDVNEPISNSSLFEHWSAVRDAAGIPDIHLHDLRRTCATYLADQGANLSVVSRGVLNHTNLQTTSIYVQQMQAPVARALEAHSAVLRKMGG